MPAINYKHVHAHRRLQPRKETFITTDRIQGASRVKSKYFPFSI